MPTPPSHSLARRLALIVAVSAALLLTSLAWASYWILEREFLRSENDSLDDTVALLQTVFSQNEDVLVTLRRDLPSDLEAFHFNRYQLRIDDGRGAKLYESARFPQTPAATLERLPLYDVGQSGPGITVHEAGNSYLMLQARALRQRGSTEKVHLVVALDTTEKTRTLAAYRRLLASIVLLGSGLAALVGHLVARQSLAPLKRMTSLVQDIKLEHLGPRFGHHSWPSELLPLAREFDRLLGEIQRGLDRLSGFSLELAHELRTPLTSLRLQTEVALTQPRSVPEYQRILASSMEEFERLSQLMERLLLLARTEASRHHLQLETLRVRPYLEQLLDGYAAERASEFRLAGDKATTLRCDPGVLEIALGNLLRNALKYGHAPYELGWSEEGGRFRLWVADSGPGIAPEHHPFLFDRLYRTELGSADSSHGLGLALVRSAVNAHCGDVQLSSTPQGSRFTMELPNSEAEC